MTIDFLGLPKRGSLPISGQNAQKYINELTEKYMKEMDKFLNETK